MGGDSVSAVFCPVLKLFLPLLFCCTTLLRSQDIRFETLTTEDGLPDGTIVCMLKDAQGYLWIGTYSGLARYDGYSFKIFGESRDDSTGLWGRIIYAMHQDKNGFIWLATVGGGLNRFDPRTEKFAHYLHDSTNEMSLSHDFVYAIHEDNRGRLWVGTRGGLDLFDPSRGEFLRIHPSPRETIDHPAVQVTAILEDASRDGILWVGTWGDGVIEIDVNSNSIKHFRDKRNQTPLPYKDVRFLQHSTTESDVLWVGTEGGGLAKFNVREGSIVAYTHEPSNDRSISNNNVRSMLQDRSGNCWVGTSGGGLCRFDPSREEFVSYRHDSKDSHGLPNNNILSLLEDESGVCWIGSRTGVSRFSIQTQQFTVFQNDPLDANSLSDDFLYSIFEDASGILWIATGKGLNRYDPGKGRFRSYQYNVKDASSLRNNQVRTIYEDRRGQLWVGNTNGVLHRFDKKTGKSKSIIVVPPRADSECDIRSMLDDSYGTFWVGTRRGLYVVDRQGWKSVPAGIEILEQNSSVEVNVNSLYEDSNHVLWIGVLPLGLIAYDIKTGTVVQYGIIDSTGQGSGLRSREVTYAGSDKKGNLWVCTFGGGLNMFEKEKRVFTSFARKEGVPDYLYGFIEDSHGNLWLGSNNGLCKFDPETKRTRLFTLKHGLPSIEFNSRSFCRARNGVAYFGSTNGMLAFNPDSIVDNEHVPPVVIAKMEIFQQEFSGDTAINYLTNVVLPYDQNFLSFEFAALDFKDPGDNVYAYKLEGLDNDWVDSGPRRYVAYTDIHPGEYLLRVRASNNDGYWNHEGAKLALTILPPWWETGWAYSAYALAILGALYLVRRFDRNRDRLKHQAELEHLEAAKLREIDHLKSRFFANISHEFRTPLTLIEGPIKLLKSGTYNGDAVEQYEIILRNSQRLQRLVNQLLDLAKIESGEMRLRFRQLDLVDLVKGAVAAFESLAKQKGILFNVDYANDRITGCFDRDGLEKIVTNLLSNAFKFTGAGGQILVTVTRTQGEGMGMSSVLLTVSDSGIGIPEDQIGKIFDRFYQVDASQTREHEGSGIGLALTKELVELHKGKITVVSEKGKGTTFTVWLPAGNEFLPPSQVGDIPHELEPQELVSADGPTPHEGKEGNEKWANGGFPLVLIVEDNTDMRRYMRTSLDSNYRVIESANGEEGMQKATEILPDIIISDVMMPKMDGFTFCAQLKTDERTSHIPVILLTAKAGADQKIAGLETGADDYVTKPFDAKELLARVKNLIDQRRKLRERFAREVKLKPAEIAITSADERFLNKAMEVVEAHIPDHTFTAELFAKEMYLSQMQLHRKIKSLTNRSPWEFVRTIRLERASQLLRKQAGTIGEIAFEVGYSDPSHFADAFRKQFGVSPSEFVHGK